MQLQLICHNRSAENDSIGEVVIFKMLVMVDLRCKNSVLTLQYVYLLQNHILLSLVTLSGGVRMARYYSWQINKVLSGRVLTLLLRN